MTTSQQYFAYLRKQEEIKKQKEAKTKASRATEEKANRAKSAKQKKDSQNPNRNLESSVVQGNESNTRAITSFNSTAENMTNNFNRNTSDVMNRNMAEGTANTRDYQNQLGANEANRAKGASRQANLRNRGMENAYSDYSQQNTALADQYGNRLDQSQQGFNDRLQGSQDQYSAGLGGAFNQYNQESRGVTDRFNRGSDQAFNQYDQESRGAQQGYDQRSRALLDQMGTADQDLHTRLRGQSYGGLDTGFADASDDLQASLARRGLSNAGIGAKAMGDLAQDRMRAGAQAGVNAYTGAIDQSDARRGQKLQGESALYGAEADRINQGYGANTNRLGSQLNAGIGQANSIYGANAQMLGDQFAGRNNVANSIYGADTNRLGSQYQADQGANQNNYGARTNTIGGAYDTNMRNVNDNFTNRNNLAGTNFNTSQADTNNRNQMQMGQLGQQYGNSMGVRSQALQNTLNNNQQRQANLMGFNQLGRGMAGMSQNYLGQAGSGYGNIGSQAGQTAIGLGGLNNNFNATQQQAKDNAKGSTGSIIGAGANLLGNAGGMAMFSDERLKKNIKKVGELNGIDLVLWEWNDVAKDAGINDNTFGVIAQDVLADHPEAVMMDYSTGFYKVNYHKLFGKDL